MKKTAGILVFLFIITTAQASVGITNEISASSDYLAYSLGVSTNDEPFSISGTLDMSGSQGHNFSISPGAGGNYIVNDNLSFSFDLNYTGNTSYPVYKMIYTNALSKQFEISYKYVLKAWAMSPGMDVQFDFFGISPFFGVTFNSFGGYLEIQPVQEPVFGQLNYDEKIAENSFTEFAPGTGMSFKLPEKFVLSMSGTWNFYDANIREILDSGTSTITTNSQLINQQALKSAVTFNDYSLSADISKTIDVLYLKFSLYYAKYITPSTETAIGHSSGITLAGSYDINDNFTPGLKLEGSRSYCTDGTFVDSVYIYIDADFYIVSEDKDSILK
ncbi:MAG: hypothetical protein LLG37_03120 [Spirochaetia bacterium]|nr:hypothetical protein [Spirochaetia bacterium]